MGKKFQLPIPFKIEQDAAVRKRIDNRKVNHTPFDERLSTQAQAERAKRELVKATT